MLELSRWKASDVHIEPEWYGFRIRLMEFLHEVLNIDEKTYNLYKLRIKLISGLKLSKKPSTGRKIFLFGLTEYEVSMRTLLYLEHNGRELVMENFESSVDYMGSDGSTRIEKNFWYYRTLKFQKQTTYYNHRTDRIRKKKKQQVL